MIRKSLAAFAVMVLAVVGLTAATTASATGGPGGHDKVTICHATQGVNLWVVESVDKNAINNHNGHSSHSGDIIPAFDGRPGPGASGYPAFPGKNLTTVFGWGPTGAQILANGCALPERPKPTEPSPNPLVETESHPNGPTCDEPTVKVGDVVTTTTWTFDEAKWEWVSTVDVDDQRVEKSLTPQQIRACQPRIVTRWVTWETTLKDGVTTPLNGGDVTWPQKFIGKGKINPTECGVWYQQDKYVGTKAQIAELYADGWLRETPPGSGNYEDAGLVKDWRFVYGGDCVGEQNPIPVVVDPVPEAVPPTCDTAGSVDPVDGIGYTWTVEVVDGYATLTAVADDDHVFLEGAQTKWEFDLNKLTGETNCPTTIDEGPDDGEPDPVDDPATEVEPSTVTQTSLAETGFPLLGVLGLAGAFSLIGGGLVNARRLVRKSA